MNCPKCGFDFNSDIYPYGRFICNECYDKLEKENK